MEIESRQECEGRMRKARLWMRLGQRATLAFGALFGLMILTFVLMGALPIFGKSTPAGLFGDIIFVVISLLIVSGLGVLACNFMRNLYQKGSPCEACNPLQTNCSECGFQKPVRLESKKDG